MVARAIERRRALINSKTTDAYRVFSGRADGVDGVYVDVYGEGAVLMVYKGRAPAGFERAESSAAGEVLEALKPLGVRGVYRKFFVKDRSRMGGEMPESVMDATPAAGEALPEAMVIREGGWKLEVRLYDGLSTGLFLDQRENRMFVSRWAAERGRARPGEVSVLNTFAYTCGFSVAAALGGAATTSVDVSGRYLEWGKRSFAHNGIAAEAHRFAKMDTFEFLGYAKRKGLRYDFIVLDPPSFASGSKRKGIRAWSSVADYAKLVAEASAVLKPRGVILASTNTQELCRPGRLAREIVKGVGREPTWVRLPAPPVDFAREQDRFAALGFGVG